MKKLFMVLLLALCTTLVFAEEKYLFLGDNVKGWRTGHLRFTEDTYITEVSTVFTENTKYFKVVYSNGYVEYYSVGSHFIDPDGKEFKVKNSPNFYNYLKLEYTPPADQKQID